MDEGVKADGQEQGWEQRCRCQRRSRGLRIRLFLYCKKCSVKTNPRHRQQREIYPANQSLSLLSVAFFRVPCSGHGRELLPGAQFPAAGEGRVGWGGIWGRGALPSEVLPSGSLLCLPAHPWQS